jgi:hypothetical protein
MERVAFLVDRTGIRINCLLNPESIVVRRRAGVRPRRLTVGSLTGERLTDDPLIFTGGGETTLELDLLFDISLADATMQVDDVRTLTGPLFELAENSQDVFPSQRPPLVHFVWGKSWNVPGVITAVAERLEYFTPEGIPSRSWLRLRMLRVQEPIQQDDKPRALPPDLEWLTDESNPPNPNPLQFDETLPNGDDIPGGKAAQRLDQIGYELFGDPGYWRIIARLNNIDDPLNVEPGQLLRIPSLGQTRRSQ